MATEIRQARGVEIRARATWSRRALAALLLMPVLPALGAGSAAADDHLEPPVVLASRTAEMGSTPGAIVVRWDHSGLGVHDFLVVREADPPLRVGENIHPGRRDYPDLGLQPDTAYRYKVCAYFNTEDEEPACSDWVEGRTTPPEAPPPPPQPPSQPRIIGHDGGQTWIGINWEAGYDYNSYFVFAIGPFGTAKGLEEVRAFKHDHDGTRGNYTVGGLLPGRAYTFVVQGCTETLLGLGADNCRETSKSPGYRATTLPVALHSGPDTCAPPFVWREAFAGDHVCVEVGRRTQVAKDNALAQSRRAFLCTPPNCTFTAPDTCKVPYVWREARPSDHVCVEVKERTQVAAENKLANQRRAAP
jgi:hypothetical protein